MKTVSDFIKARSGLSVTCRNCDHQGFFTARFLKDRLGLYGKVIDANFTCGLCRSTNVKLSACAAELADKDLAPGMAFGGVYAKHID